MNLQWMPPKYPNGVITKYSVHFDGRDIVPFGSNVSNRMIGTIEGLSPDTLYILEMKAYTKAGPSLPLYLAVRTRKLMNSGVSFTY